MYILSRMQTTESDPAYPVNRQIDLTKAKLNELCFKILTRKISYSYIFFTVSYGYLCVAHNLMMGICQ